jgi:hypothetical protein
VQASLSAQSAFDWQQFCTSALTHSFAVQVSVVQAFPSLQSGSLTQHPCTGVLSHRFVVVLQASVVHGF